VLVNVATPALIVVTAQDNLARGSPTVIVQAALVAGWLYVISRYVRTGPHMRQAINTAVAILGVTAALLFGAGMLHRAVGAG
jgi:hypothetical protein